MKRIAQILPLSTILLLVFGCTRVQMQEDVKTAVSIRGQKFFINDRPTYEGRVWNNHPIEGLLFNSRMVQGIFDDLNEETRGRWKYPDTGIWDPNRNTDAFIAAMPSWKAHGMLSFTINMQGGSPMGYGNQGWYNSSFTGTGELRPEFMARLKKILDAADELGMIPIVGLFYFGQDQNLDDEAAVIQATENAINWLLDQGYENLLIEINNECDVDAWDHDILKPGRVHELILRAKGMEHDGRRLLVSTSFKGNAIPDTSVVRVSDFILIHGNGVNDPARITQMVRLTRELPTYRTMPILFNEDDHYDFEKPMNNMVAAVYAYASWGLFDYRRDGEAFEEGFQSVPVDWRINSERKKGFFGKVKEITGY